MKSDRKRAIAEVKREIALRQNVYPKFVGNGRMSQKEADQHVEALMLSLRYLMLPESASALLEKHCPREIGEPCTDCSQGACRIFYLIRLVETSICPNKGCDGNGFPVQIGEEEWAQEQCEWCDARRRILPK